MSEFLERIYDDVGAQIKGLAKVLFVLEVIASAIAAITFLVGAMDSYGSEAEVISFIVVLIVGPLAAWVTNIPLYGFGELIEKATKIEYNTKTKANRNATNSVDKERISKLENLLEKGLITEQEYKNEIMRYKELA